MNEKEVFARIPANVLKPWLEAERDKAYKYLTQAGDLPQIHRAQGRVQLIEVMLDLLDKSQNSR